MSEVNYDNLESGDRRTFLEAARSYLVESLQEPDLPATGKAALMKQLIEVNKELMLSGGSDQQRKIDAIKKAREARKRPARKTNSRPSDREETSDE